MIAIIAILVSILLPSLNKARDAARNVACISNLRQNGTAIMIYADSSNEIIPVRLDSSDGGYTRFWAQVVHGEIPKTARCPVFHPGDTNPVERELVGHGKQGTTGARHGQTERSAGDCPHRLSG